MRCCMTPPIHADCATSSLANVRGSAVAKAPTPTSAPAAPAAPAASFRKPTGVELATAFDGAFERRHTSPLFYLGLLFTAAGMLLLPLVYLALLVGIAWLTYLHARYDIGM